MEEVHQVELQEDLVAELVEVHLVVLVEVTLVDHPLSLGVHHHNHQL
jgi:hypothetical protein